MKKRDRFSLVDLAAIKPAACPCGSSRRAFVADPDKIASLHAVEIKKDSQTHYHKAHSEVYYILEGEGQMELDGTLHPVRQGFSVLIKPGCRHRAVGKLKIINVSIPTFDPEDEWFD